MQAAAGGKGRHPATRGAVVAVAAAMLLAVPTFEAVGDGSLAPVSGPRTPLEPGCDAGTSHGFEGDHTIALHPGDPDQLVAVWAQDAESSLGIARSHDGGLSWTPTTAPGFALCDGAGDPFGHVFDAWASTGADGRTYVSAATATPSPIPPDPEGGYGVVVATTFDGGRSWEHSVVVARSVDLLPTDKPTITADPRVAGRAWVVWTEISIIGGTSVTRIARTDDGGRTWTAPRLILPSPPVHAEFGNQLVPLPDGSLVRVFSRFSAQPLALTDTWIGGGTAIVAARSIDGGRTWRETPVAEVPDSVLRDPETGRDLAFGIPFVVADVAAEGSTIAVAWAETTPGGRVRLARSVDGGRRWRTETVAVSPQPTFRATVALGGGRTSVAYSDLGGDVSGDSELTTRTVLATLERDGRWSHQPVGPSHDLRRSPTSSATGIPGGDYWGLVHAGPATVVGINLPSTDPRAGPTQLFAWRN